MRLIAKKQSEPNKDKSQFQHPLPKQWLRPYWAETISAGRPLDEPIPKIHFDSYPHPETVKNIKDCIDYMSRKGFGPRESWMAFIDCLLWGFGTKMVNDFPEKVSEEVSWHWYKKFNLGLMLKHPTDHMAWGSCEIAGMAYSGNGNGYFPTPGNVVSMMTQMTMTEADKTKKVCDCCLGTGTILLYASNYSLRLYGQDISLEMVKMATVNAWIYIPWLAYNVEDNVEDKIDWNTPEDYRDALKRIEEWKSFNLSSIAQLEYKPRSNSLDGWF